MMVEHVDETLVKAWIAHLEQELQAHRVLLAATERAGEALVTGTHEMVSAEVASEQEALATLSQLGVRRIRLRDLTAEQMGCVSAELRLGQLLPLAPEDYRERLAEVVAQLEGVAMALKRSNERNLTVARTGLGVVGGILSTLTGAGGDDGSYRRNGQATSPGAGTGAVVSFEA
ncbi:MAG: flagellar protein FlgN [Planctomycetota bacterium]|jgi:hypothetical protein